MIYNCVKCISDIEYVENKLKDRISLLKSFSGCNDTHCSCTWNCEKSKTCKKLFKDCPTLFNQYDNAALLPSANITYLSDLYTVISIQRCAVKCEYCLMCAGFEYSKDCSICQRERQITCRLFSLSNFDVTTKIIDHPNSGVVVKVGTKCWHDVMNVFDQNI
ncbi:hypothetical protein GJ496_000372 [Pomphorhynchus laevis]|nr:hypothetical protein GJ496_000372 [Pomphorhynchus laevis]